MLADRFGLSLSTSSAAARDAYVDASERALTFYPGALAAYDSAIAGPLGAATIGPDHAHVCRRVPSARRDMRANGRISRAGQLRPPRNYA
jgi:hypothetical protein